MASRPGKQLGLWVSDETAKKLATLSERTGIAQSGLLRRALELLFESHGEIPVTPKKKAKAPRQERDCR